MHRRSMMTIPPLLFLAVFSWTVEAWGRPEDTEPSGSRNARSYQAPIDRAPDVLCGCTEILKNFA